LLFFSVYMVPAAAAQRTGTLAGEVTDAETNEPLPGANVVLTGTSLGASVGADGSYRIEEVPEGSYTVRVSFVGYEASTFDVSITAGSTTRQNAALQPRTFLGDEIVVTGSRRAEKVLDSPVNIQAISAQQLQETGGGTFLSALSNLKGVDFVDVGINGQGISARGFNNHFNTRMLSMTDGRVAQLPGTGLPQGNFLPTSQLDVQSIEVIVGPASALYGPNAHTGVVNVITKSPWDESGVALDVRGGQNDLFDTNIRMAGTVNDAFGWKVTGQYLTATDFRPERGPAPAAGEAEPHYYSGAFPANLGSFEADLIEDYDVESISTEGSLYYRFAGDWMLEGSFGFSENDNLGITNNGRNRILGWQVNYQNIQLSSSNWYAQFTRTANDAGDTYQINGVGGSVAGLIADPDNNINGLADVDLPALREANRFTDKGELLDSELQYSNSVGNLEFITGAQLRQYNPDSEGTFLADGAGQDISATEVGGYVQADYYMLDDRLRLNTAARIDDHSDYGTQFSPKAALVYTVAPENNLRIGYNRAFKSPTVLESNLRIGDFVRGNIDGYTLQDPDGNVVGEISPLEPEEVNSLEIGYKGQLGNRVYVDAVAYNSWYTNFISPLSGVADGANVIATEPDGTVIGPLFTYTNFGEATVRGVELGLNYFASDRFNLSGNVTWIDLADFEKEESAPDLNLNVPEVKLKGSATMRNVGFDNYSVSLTGRWQSAYEFQTAYWNSNAMLDDGEIDARFVANLNVNYSIPQTGVNLQLSVSNLFNNEGTDVLGGPVRDRLIWLGATYRFNGLRF
jgi:iron complex outermembrane receptor protein